MASEGTPLIWQASTPAPTAHYDNFHRSILPELNALVGRHQALPQGGAGVRARVAQLDAGRLDQEMTGMLQEQMTKALKYFTPGVMASLQPEVTLLLDLLLSHPPPPLRHSVRCLTLCMLTAGAPLKRSAHTYTALGTGFPTVKHPGGDFVADLCRLGVVGSANAR
mmetsp:Transcript_7025/g.20555  ORF Transcript_7025/g.20555 Transcript_7025/m.20555 type:complete len:166 (+) Transcript_7025:316-813(+)